MKNLREKLNKENGFTLVEMLIVVAIIAILIAISIPMVNKSLERAREATDAANERAALGAAMVEVLGENKLGGTAIADAAVTALYRVGGTGTSDVSGMGVLVPESSTETTGFDYGKGTKAGDNPAVNAGKCIKITFDPTKTSATEQFKVEWTTKS